MSHEAESLHERTAMVAGGHAFCEVVGEYGVGVVDAEVSTFGLTEESYTPVVVGRKTVTQIVGSKACEVCACVETLVTDEHAAEETA